MSTKCVLYYDTTCPICVNFVSVLKRKINASEISYKAADKNSTDFKFVLESGDVFIGTEAISKMAERFPVLNNYFWMLPEKFRTSGLQAAYKIGSAARKVLKKVGGCNCGK